MNRRFIRPTVRFLFRVGSLVFTFFFSCCVPFSKLRSGVTWHPHTLQCCLSFFPENDSVCPVNIPPFCGLVAFFLVCVFYQLQLFRIGVFHDLVVRQFDRADCRNVVLALTLKWIWQVHSSCCNAWHAKLFFGRYARVWYVLGPASKCVNRCQKHEATKWRAFYLIWNTHAGPLCVYCFFSCLNIFPEMVFHFRVTGSCLVPTDLAYYSDGYMRE